MSLENELERLNPVVFTNRDVCRMTGKSPAYCKVLLNRVVKANRVIKIERGKYCLKKADVLAVASNLVFPSYVSFLSALEFHGLTTQMPSKIQVVCLKQKKDVLFENTPITFTTISKRRFFGFQRVDGPFIADPEKAITDGLYMPQKMPITEAGYAITHGKINVKKLIGYARRFDSSIIRKRLGYLLEKAGINAEALSENLTWKYDLLNPLLPVRGPRDKKWKLIINEAIE